MGVYLSRIHIKLMWLRHADCRNASPSSPKPVPGSKKREEDTIFCRIKGGIFSLFCLTNPAQSGKTIMMPEGVGAGIKRQSPTFLVTVPD
jgi:hypothetical protein